MPELWPGDFLHSDEKQKSLQRIIVRPQCAVGRTGILLAGVPCDVNGVSIDDKVTHAPHIAKA